MEEHAASLKSIGTSEEISSEQSSANASASSTANIPAELEPVSDSLQRVTALAPQTLCSRDSGHIEQNSSDTSGSTQDHKAESPVSRPGEAQELARFVEARKVTRIRNIILHESVATTAAWRAEELYYCTLYIPSC